MLPTRDQSLVKTTLESTLVVSAKVSRKATTSDGAGGQIETPLTKIYDTVTRIASLGGSPAERVIAEKLSGQIVYVLWFKKDLTLLMGDIVEADGHTFVMQLPIKNTVSVLQKCACTETV